MQKKNLKPLILSALAAVAMAGVGTGATFALFTDKAETQINVQAGIVDVDAEISELAFYELGVTTPITNTDSSGAYVNSIGGTAKIDGSTLVLNKWAPGDKVTFKLTTKNKSNVKIRTKLREAHSTTSSVDLYEALNITYARESGIAEDKIFHWSPVEAAVNAEGDIISVINVTIEFPNHGDLITAREEGIDNHFQNSNCTIVFSQQAVQGNAETVDLVSQWNQILADNEGVNNTLTAAIEEVEGTEAQLKSERIVWNGAEDKFYYEEEVAPENRYQYFKAYDAMPVVQNWSVYASKSWAGTNLAISLKGIGFDVGSKAADIASVSYVGEATERTNSIYTNSASTNITINAPLDTVYHYGVAGILDIQAVAGSSYHEFGKVAFAEISKGRIALEENSEVAQIHVEKKTESTFDEIIISKHPNVELPTLSRDEVTIPSGGTLVFALQEGTEDLDYFWLTKQGVFEQVAISDNKASAVSTDTKTVYADQVSSNETKDAAQQIANNVADQVVIGAVTYNVSVSEETREIVLTNNAEPTQTASAEATAAAIAAGDVVTESGLKKTEKEQAAAEQVAIATVEEDGNNAARIGAHGYTTLEAAVAAAQDGDTIVLLKNIALNNQTIDVKKSINIDGSGYTITAVNDNLETNKNYYVFSFEDETGPDEVLDCAVRNLTINTTGYQEAFMMNDYDCELSNKNQLLLDKVTVSTQGGAVYSNGRSVITVKNSTFNRNGEYLAGKAQPYYAAVQVGYGGTINLEGVTINSDHIGIATYPSGGTVNSRNTNITIATGGDYAAYAWHEQSYDAGNYADWCDSATINIYSGNINGALAENLVGHTAGSVRNRVAEVYLYGGTYDRDVTAYCAAGYRAKQVEPNWQVVEMCQNHNFQYTSINEDYHKKVCTVCGVEETHMHVYDATNLESKACLECGHEHKDELLTLTTPKNVIATNSIITAVNAINESDDAGDYVITFATGEYLVPLNLITLVQEQGKNVLFKALAPRTQISGEFYQYNVVLRPNFNFNYSGTGASLVSGGNNDMFKISGDSNYGNETAKFMDIMFDLSEWTDSIDPVNNGRIFGVSCLYGNENRYAHDITVEKCGFLGNGGKRSSAVGSNHSNSSPRGITIKDCTADKLNCWFNGYGNDITVDNCNGTNMLCVANLMSGSGTFNFNKVYGSYFAQLSKDGKSALAGGTEWGAIYTKGGTINVTNCNFSTGRGTKTGNKNGIVGINEGTVIVNMSGNTFTKTVAEGYNTYDVYHKNGGSYKVNGEDRSAGYNLPTA